MKKIWKFPLGEIPGKVSLQIPALTTILSAQMQNGMLCLWGIVDTERSIDTREFVVIGTGWTVPQHKQFIATVQDDDFVWHVFEV